MKASAVRTVAKEIADVLEHSPVCLTAPNHLGLFYEVPKASLQRWLLTLCPPRKRRVKDPRTKERRATVRELDLLCREIIFLRDKGECRLCGREAKDWSHIFSRRYKWMRWVLENSYASCKKCHLDYHHRPLEGAEKVKEMLGPTLYESLRHGASRPQKADTAKWKLYLEAEKRRLGG